VSKVTYNRSLHEYFIVMGRKVRRDSRENVAVMMKLAIRNILFQECAIFWLAITLTYVN